MKRQMRDPEKWIGKKIKNLRWLHFWRVIDRCDDCQCFFWVNDLHPLLFPVTEEDFALQQRLHVEEAQSFCPDCLAVIEMEADKVDPQWAERHGYK